MSVKISYSPDFYGETDEAYYVEGGLAYAVSGQTSVDVHFGDSQYKDDVNNDDYSDYNIGVTTSYEWFDLDVRYWDTQSLSSSQDGSFIISISGSQ